MPSESTANNATRLSALASLGSAGLGAAGMGVSAYLQYKASRNAQRSQAKAGMNALGHELRGEKRESQERERMWEDYRERHRQWEERNFGNRELSRPGTQRTAPPGTPGAPQNHQAGRMPTPGPMPAPAPVPARGMPLGDLMSIPALAGTGQAPTPAGRSLMDLEGWQDWRNTYV